MSGIKEEIEEMLETTTKVITAVIENDKLRALQAVNCRLMFEAYLEEGFSEAQAMELTSASVRATSK